MLNNVQDYVVFTVKIYLLVDVGGSEFISILFCALSSIREPAVFLLHVKTRWPMATAIHGGVIPV